MDDVKEWTGLSLNDIWREPEDSVARGKRANRVAPNVLHSLWESRFLETLKNKQ